MSTDTAEVLPPDARGTITYDAAQVVVFAGQARRMLANAKDFSIDSDEMLTAAGEDLQRVKALQKQVEETRTSITGPLNVALRAINALFKGPAEYLADAENTLKRAMLTYNEEQEAKRREEQRRAEEIRRAEEARLAEIQRQQEAEARAAEQRARAAQEEAEAAAAAGNAAAAEEARLRAQEESARAEEAAAEAHHAAVTAEVITMPIATAAAPKVSGISTAKTVDFDVFSLHELVKHIASHPELINLICADSVKLRAYVRGLGMNCQLPGVRVYEKKTMSARAA